MDISPFFSPGHYSIRHADHSAPQTLGKAAVPVGQSEVTEVEKGNPRGYPLQIGFTLPVKIIIPGEKRSEKFNLFIDTGSCLTWLKAEIDKLPENAKEKHIEIDYGDETCFRGYKADAKIQYSECFPKPFASLKQYLGFGQLHGDVSVDTPYELEQMKDGLIGLCPSNHATSIIKELKRIEGRGNNAKKQFTRTTLEDNATVLGHLHRTKNLKRIVGIYFTPLNCLGAKIMIGGCDERRMIEGDSVWTKMVEVRTASWRINQSIHYGKGEESAKIEGPHTTLLDTGTASLLLPLDGWERYRNITHAYYDHSCKAWLIHQDDYIKLQSLYFTINGKTFEYPRDAQVWPRALNEQLKFPKGVPANTYVLTVGKTSTKTLAVNGLAWCEWSFSIFIYHTQGSLVERFYVVLDEEKQ